MTEAELDILVDIPDEDLPKLAKIYEEHKEWAPHAYGMIMTGIEWKKSKNAKCMTFMSPNNCWRDDGTFFVLIECYSFIIFISTLDKAGKNVFEAIKKTSRLDTNISDMPRVFYSIHNDLYPTVERALKDKNIKKFKAMSCYLYVISKDQALKFDIQCPPDVYIKKLDRTHAATVNSLWPHRSNKSEKYVEEVIETNVGYGVFLKSSDELVAWALISVMGELALLQTADKHKKKGYGTLITKYLSKVLAEKGHNALGAVVVENKAAQIVFDKMGFKSIGMSTFAFL